MGVKLAILPLFGTIFPRANLMTTMSGATSAEVFANRFQALVADPEIGAILLDVNSPGGQVSGVPELADLIYTSRGSKPIVAIANHMAASAAYWIASAADELIVTPSGAVGSVGVFAGHADRSKAYEQDGVKVTLISAGEYKTEGNPYQPLSEDAKAAMQADVNRVYEQFISALARNRGVEDIAVYKDFGQGRMVDAETALQVGMVDRIDTMNATIQRLMAGLVQQNPITNSSAQVAGNSQPAANAVEETAETSADDNPSERQVSNLRDEVQQFLAKGAQNMDLKATYDAVAAAYADAQTVAQEIDALIAENKTDEALALRDKFQAAQKKADDLQSLYNEMADVMKSDAAKAFVPLGGKTEADADKPKSMSRAEFDSLSHAEKSAFILEGGVIADEQEN